MNKVICKPFFVIAFFCLSSLAFAAQDKYEENVDGLIINSDTSTEERMELSKLYSEALNNDISKQIVLAHKYELGLHLKKDIKEAEKWYLLAAKSGNITAQSMLGVLYYKEENSIKSKKWLLKASKQGHIESDFYLCSFKLVKQCNLKYDINSLNIDEDVSIENIAETYVIYHLANNNDTGSQINLAHKYQLGLHLKKDIQKAKKWYLIAAKTENENAQKMLGELYYKINDFKNSKIWLSKSAEQGNFESKYLLKQIKKEELKNK